MKLHLIFFVLAVAIWSQRNANADIVKFIATGAAGEGLLEGNILPTTGEQGSGGIGSAGIIYNTDNNILRVHVEWGSANGYTDLSADAFRVHLHGPTPSSGDAAFGEVAPLLISLSTSVSFDASASSGGINDLFFVDQTDEQALLDGRMYINVHLSSEDKGVIRGYLQPVPEPGSIAVLGAIGVLISCRRRRRSSRCWC